MSNDDLSFSIRHASTRRVTDCGVCGTRAFTVRGWTVFKGARSLCDACARQRAGKLFALIESFDPTRASDLDQTGFAIIPTAVRANTLCPVYGTPIAPRGPYDVGSWRNGKILSAAGAKLRAPDLDGMICRMYGTAPADAPAPPEPDPGPELPKPTRPPLVTLEQERRDRADRARAARAATLAALERAFDQSTDLTPGDRARIVLGAMEGIS